MDGNGRWANARGRPRTAGHIAGARVVRKIVEAAPDCGIGMLTLYAFSADNWARPSREVALLMRLFRRYLVAETDRCVTNDVRMRIIGRRDRIPSELLRAIKVAEDATRHGTRLDLRIAVDYSARDAMVRAMELLAASDKSPVRISPAPCATWITGRASAGRRSPHPHRRRAASERLPALGVRLRRALLHRSSLAGLQPRRPRARGAGVPLQRAAVRDGAHCCCRLRAAALRGRRLRSQ